jgi:hypothetical protein
MEADSPTSPIQDNLAPFFVLITRLTIIRENDHEIRFALGASPFLRAHGRHLLTLAAQKVRTVTSHEREGVLMPGQQRFVLRLPPAVELGDTPRDHLSGDAVSGSGRRGETASFVAPLRWWKYALAQAGNPAAVPIQAR